MTTNIATATYEECELFIRQAYEVRSHLIAQAKNYYALLPKCDQPFHWVELEHRITLIHSNFIILRDAARLLVRANPSEQWRFGKIDV